VPKPKAAGESPTSNEYAADDFLEWALVKSSQESPELPQTADSNLEVTQQFLGRRDIKGIPISAVSASDRSSTEPMIVSPRDLPIAPELLTDYQIRGVVGKGGMGIVVRARDKKLNRDVAIKFLVPELARHEAARERFLREARAAAAVRHDNVVTIHSVREVDGVPLLEMELIQGESLAERIQRTGQMSALEVARLAMQIARGLDAAHKRGLIHRDIKPGNILLEAMDEVAIPRGNADAIGFCRAKITDFGLARVASEESLTNSGLIAGTPQYMSPEQADGKDIDHRSDLFSLGSVMYAMCAGRAPFHADSALGILRQVSDFAPPTLRERNGNVPTWMVAIIDRLMAKNPDDRFQSAGEVIEVLSRDYEIACKSPESSSGGR
jgi:serine/threonine protein kinase